MEDILKIYRSFLKDTIRKEIDFSETDQSRGVNPPSLEKPFNKSAKLVDLVDPSEFGNFSYNLVEAITNRKSLRKFSNEHLTLTELSFLLWTTQGIRKIVNQATALRYIPSAGSRHVFETYIYARNVEGLEKGVYRYLPVEHKLVFEFSEENMTKQINEACLGQKFVGECAATFMWSAIPYRMEWRYSLASYKFIAIDAGHVCQNLYLACEAVNAGTCAVGAYDQEKMDSFLKLDGEKEFTIYIAPVGKK